MEGGKMAEQIRVNLSDEKIGSFLRKHGLRATKQRIELLRKFLKVVIEGYVLNKEPDIDRYYGGLACACLNKKAFKNEIAITYAERKVYRRLWRAGIFKETWRNADEMEFICMWFEEVIQFIEV